MEDVDVDVGGGREEEEGEEEEGGDGRMVVRMTRGKKRKKQQKWRWRLEVGGGRTEDGEGCGFMVGGGEGLGGVECVGVWSVNALSSSPKAAGCCCCLGCLPEAYLLAEGVRSRSTPNTQRIDSPCLLGPKQPRNFGRFTACETQDFTGAP
ncbi:hypothetical protein PABG_06682 [Paracoccidioides brasiliensis Pb03]|nr:hypothetical protein PABG_06682 [Paracoccidioides brasiliensis Pb03]